MTKEKNKLLGLHNIKEDNKKPKRRIGRGDTTAGRGGKGQKARTGKSLRDFFGEDRFYVKLPVKRGFFNTKKCVKSKFVSVRLDQINLLPEDVSVNSKNLVSYKIIPRDSLPKIINSGKYDGKKRDMSLFDGKMSKSVSSIIKK